MEGSTEVLKIVVQVEVIFVDAAKPREAKWIQGVYQHDTCVSRQRLIHSVGKVSIWQPEPQNPSTPCVPEIRIDKLLGLTAPNCATSTSGKARCLGRK